MSVPMKFVDCILAGYYNIGAKHPFTIPETIIAYIKEFKTPRNMQSIQQSILKIQKQGTSEQNIKKKQQIPILK